MTGTLFFNDIDAYTQYGIIMAEGAISALICPSPSKSYVSTNSRLENGNRYITKYVKQDERQLTLSFFIMASSREEMFTKLKQFCTSVLYQGNFTLKTKYSTDKYKLIYKSCTQMQDFNGRAGKFSLSVVEPNPTDRT